MIGNLIGKMADAQKLSIAQIQKAVASGSLPSYIGIPLIEEKTKEAQKYQMAQAILKEQGAPDVSVKDQVMQAADQVTRPEPPVMPSTPDGYRQQPAPSQGVEALASNMPEEYAGGGIIAFANTGMVPGVPDDIVIPGKDKDDKDTKAAGYTEGRSALSRVIDPDEAELRPWARKALDAYTGGIDYLADRFAERPIVPEKYQSLAYRGLAPSPDLGVTPIAAPAPQGDGLEFLNKPRLPQSSAPMGPDYLTSLGAPPSTVPTPEARPTGTPATPATGREGIRLTPGAELPQAPQAPEFPSFEGLEKSYGDYVSDSRTRRQKLEDMILGQQADRPERERKNVGTSLMEAGFGMMAGESPFAGVNIGRGAMLGAKSYAQGIEQLQKDDARIVSQLASLGLRGEELEQQAMKYGIDIQKMKTEAPYVQAQTAETLARVPGLKMQPQVMSADVAEKTARTGLLGVETQKTATEAELLPLKLQLETSKIFSKAKRDLMDGSISNKEYMDLFYNKRKEMRDDPLHSPIATEIYKNPALAKALTLDEDNPNRQKAMIEVDKILDQYLENFAKGMYNVSPRSRGASRISSED